jgi:hypothetical protein
MSVRRGGVAAVLVALTGSDGSSPSLKAGSRGTPADPAAARRGLRILIAATLAMASLAACSSHRPSDPPSSPAPKVLTAWQSVLRQVKPDGSVSTGTALSAFAMAVGPVPGGVVPTGPSQQIASGSIAVRWVLRHWSDLSADQRSAILTDLGINPVTNHPASYVDAQAALAPGDPPPNIPCHTADSADAAKYRAMIPGSEAAIAGKLGRQLTIDSGTFVVVNTKQSDNPAAFLYTVPCTDSSGKMIGCTFHINPHAFGASDEQMRDFFFHEMMHCFMYARYGTAYKAMPDWYAEGQANWAASVLGTPNSELISQWESYLDSSSIPLVARTNDGIGFFVHLAESGVDPWTVMDRMGDAMVADKTTNALVADPTAAAWAAAGITPGFLNTWGSGIVTGRYPGAAWNTTGPNLIRYQPSIKQAGVGNGGKLELLSVPFAPNTEQVSVTAEVLVLQAGAGTTGRMTLGNNGDTTVDNPGPYCTTANCSCPAGSPGAGATFTKLSSNAPYIGFTAGTAIGQVTMTGFSLADFCQKNQTPCVVGQWVSTGFDLHVNDIVESGGAGIKLHIDKKGSVSEVLDGMKPVVFQQSGGTPVAGSLVFNGSFTGSINLPPAAATAGTWTYASPPSMTGLSVTIHLSSPLDLNLGTFDLTNLAAAGGAGSAVSTDPVGVGSWTCSGDTLTSQPPPSSRIQGVWTLTRTGPG